MLLTVKDTALNEAFCDVLPYLSVYSKCLNSITISYSFLLHLRLLESIYHKVTSASQPFRCRQEGETVLRYCRQEMYIF